MRRPLEIKVGLGVIAAPHRMNLLESQLRTYNIFYKEIVASNRMKRYGFNFLDPDLQQAMQLPLLLVQAVVGMPPSVLNLHELRLQSRLCPGVSR